jgi:hypothetical protein
MMDLTEFASEYELIINSVMIQLRFFLDFISRSEQILKWLLLCSCTITVVPPKECAQKLCVWALFCLYSLRLNLFT